MEIAVNGPLQASLFRPASRLSSIGVSEILKITGRATDLKRQGKDVIILGTGEPDFDTPAHIKNAAARAMQAGATKYTTLDGTPELKSAIRAKFARDNGIEFTQDEITVSSGAAHDLAWRLRRDRLGTNSSREIKRRLCRQRFLGVGHMKPGRPQPQRAHRSASDARFAGACTC